MLRSMGPFVCCTLLAGGAALAQQNQIQLWQGDPNRCRITQSTKSVEIIGSGTFKFQAKAFGVLGNIDNIWISDDPNDQIQGAVEIWIVRNPTEVGGLQHEPGGVSATLS